MTFGDELKQEFDIFSSNQKLLEIELFVKLQDALINLNKRYKDYFSQIIHGSRSFVYFKVQSKYGKYKKGETVKRELSDIMFIVVSPSRDVARLTFLQNKYLPPKKTCHQDSVPLLRRLSATIFAQ